MKSYRYGYVWRHQGLIITDEREHISRSNVCLVAQSEIQIQRRILGLPKSSVATILWRQEDSDSGGANSPGKSAGY